MDREITTQASLHSLTRRPDEVELEHLAALLEANRAIESGATSERSRRSLMVRALGEGKVVADEDAPVPAPARWPTDSEVA
jgi:hypothetical protein